MLWQKMVLVVAKKWCPRAFCEGVIFLVSVYVSAYFDVVLSFSCWFFPLGLVACLGFCLCLDGFVLVGVCAVFS